MAGKINVLVIEDSEDDTLLLLHEIRNGGYDPEYIRVETAVDMSRALSEREWDVILADHRMPHFNSIEALALLKESGKDIPFIIVSGIIGEDAAVTAMKAGAVDYIRKQNLTRLAPAIERETADAEERRRHRIAEMMLDQERAFTSSIIESLSDGFSMIDMAGVQILVNSSLCSMIGYAREELIGIGPPHPNWPEEEMEQITRAFKENLAGEIGDYELVFKKKDGRRFPVIVSTSAVRDEKGSIIRYFAVIKDITERKRKEQMLVRSEARYHAVVEDTPLLICRILPDCTITL